MTDGAYGWDTNESMRQVSISGDPAKSAAVALAPAV